MYSIPCILFAGGKSSRMGENKALLPFAGESSLTKYQYERLEEIFQRVYIATKEPKLFDDIDAMFIDESAHPDTYAPTVGFVSAFKQLKAENSFFVLSVDTPFVNEELIAKFQEVQSANFDAVIVRTPSGIHPLCGIYSRSLELPLHNMLLEDNHKLVKLLEESNVFYIDIDDEDLLMNINTPQEYQDALAKVGN